MTVNLTSFSPKSGFNLSSDHVSPTTVHILRERERGQHWGDVALILSEFDSNLIWGGFFEIQKKHWLSHWTNSLQLFHDASFSSSSLTKLSGHVFLFGFGFLSLCSQPLWPLAFWASPPPPLPPPRLNTSLLPPPIPWHLSSYRRPFTPSSLKVKCPI